MPPIDRNAAPYSNPLIGRTQHIVHFYESDDDLASSVAAYFLTGLLGSCGCVAIATREHQAAIVSQLKKSGIDVEHAIRVGQLAMFDARAGLAEICASGEPDRAVFTRIASDAIQSVRRNYSYTVVFGEMVGLLVARGDVESAHLFETWCNESLLSATDVQMFCAYPKAGKIAAPDYEAICCAHSAVL